MKKKSLKILAIVIIFIILVVIIIFGVSNNKKESENVEIGVEVDKAIDVITKYNEYMADGDIESAAKLFDLTIFEEYSNISESITIDDIKEMLEECYSFDENIFSTVGDINLIDGVNDYNKYFGDISDEMTEEEYSEKYEDYLLYAVEYEADGEVINDLYILTKDSDLVMTAYLKGSTNGILTMAVEANANRFKATIEEELMIAVVNVQTEWYTDYLNGETDEEFVEYITESNLNDFISSEMTVKTLLESEDGGFVGIILYDEEIYIFTIAENEDGGWNVSVD